MSTESKQGGLDRFRIFAAFMVVAIHTSPLMSFSEEADFFLTRVLARIAVPFFFMVTGQFVRIRSGPWHYIRKVLILYGIAIVIYLPIGMYAGHYADLDILAVFRMLLFDGTFYHLWYFPACIAGVLLVYLLGRSMGVGGAMTAAGLLYLIGLFGDSYFGLIRGIPFLASIYQSGFHIWSYTRNGLFFAPLFLVLGAAVGGQKRMYRRQFAYLGLAVSFLLMTAEAFTLRYFKLQRHDSMYVMLVPVMVFLYRILLSFEQKTFPMLRTVSTWIYILHPAMIVIVRGIAKMSGIALLTDNSLIHYGAVVFLSAAAALVIAFFMEKRNVSGGKKGKDFSTGRAWIEIDREALRDNINFLKSRLPEGCRLMPAVKADAYGHGAVLMARELNRLGIDTFCVACVQEGIKLRNAGIKGEILILGYTHPAQFDLLRRYHLTQTVVDGNYARRLKKYGKKLHVHVGVDTGMHRLGERSDNIEEICRIFRMKNLIIDGIFTHLAADDTLEEKDRAFTNRQAQEFYHVIDELKERGIPCPYIHLQSSYGVLNYPELAGDYARIGIALYGVLSTKKDTGNWREKLHPVLSLKARVASVKEIYAGETAGYGLQFVAGQTMKIAVIAIGYADGLPRSLSGGRGTVLIKGEEAPVIGRICMDQTLVDVSHIPEVRTGDIAVLIGKSGDMEITACDLAERTETIANEILSRMGGRLERILV